MKKIVYIEDDYINTRLDRWFKKKICKVPQSLIEKNLRKGNIKVNNVKCKSSYKLKKGDIVNIQNLKLKPQDLPKKTYVYIPSKEELSSSSKLFIENNENFVVINKPSGISVQSGTKSNKNILDLLKSSKEFSNYLPYAVHRIDKDTTGILIVAKNRKYAQLFTSLFRIRKIHKTYLSLVFGTFKNNKGTLIDNLISYEGKKKIISKAITHYEVLDSNNNYSLLKLNPQTGRKHQIRKQLLIHGCPILGDNKYRLSEIRKNKKNTLMLHAYKINFTINQTRYNFKAELPDVFKDTIKEKYLKIF